MAELRPSPEQCVKPTLTIVQIRKIKLLQKCNAKHATKEFLLPEAPSLDHFHVLTNTKETPCRHHSATTLQGRPKHSENAGTSSMGFWISGTKHALLTQ